MNSKFIEVARQRILESSDLKSRIAKEDEILREISEAAECIINAYRNGGKVLFCGNGGSAADAQHLAAELSGKFYLDRPPLDAEALHVNTSYLTAVANDYSFDEVFARAVAAKGEHGDVLVAISTSGNSRNVIKAIDVAKTLGMVVIGLTGAKGGAMAERCDITIKVPSMDTPRIQEAHITIGHIICELVEESLFVD